jgi:hypothetical protein
MKSSSIILIQTIISLSIFWYLKGQGAIYYPQYENYINITLGLLALKVLYTNIPVFVQQIRARFDI